MIQAYAKTEVHLGQFCRRTVDHGALRISQPADLRPSDIFDTQAQGRGCFAVEADPKLAKRRKRRFARFGSAINFSAEAPVVTSLA